MSRLSFFCTRKEVTAWAGKLCEERGFAALLFNAGEQTGVKSIQPSVNGDTYRLFLMPVDEMPTSQLTMNDARARERGWLDIRAGGEHQVERRSILLISEVTGENGRAKDVAWLRRQIAGAFGRGVRRENIRTGGEFVYRDIWFSRGGSSSLARVRVAPIARRLRALRAAGGAGALGFANKRAIDHVAHDWFRNMGNTRAVVRDK